jgi:hypothetical protein
MQDNRGQAEAETDRFQLYPTLHLVHTAQIAHERRQREQRRQHRQDRHRVAQVIFLIHLRDQPRREQHGEDVGGHRRQKPYQIFAFGLFLQQRCLTCERFTV